MNRTEFMSQLGFLLRNISDGEKEEALQYYNDYFDDAGAENEQTVIEALGNPAKVAENIRRELLENQGGKPSTPADRAIVEYGKAEAAGSAGSRSTDAQSSSSGGSGGAGGWAGGGGNGGAGGWAGGGSGGAGGNGAPGRSGMSGGMVVVLAILIIFASPLILGMLCVVFGILLAWFGLILGLGVAALCMFIALFLLLAVGGMCIPVDPLVGLGVMGGGLICGGVGILLLMLTVMIAGGVPAIFRGCGRVFRWMSGIGRKKTESLRRGAT